MRHSQKHLIAEAGIAVGILALLLYFMLPHVLTMQRYGPVTSEKVIPVNGDWIWENNELVVLGNQPYAPLVFKPDIESARLSFNVFIDSDSAPLGGDQLGIVFGYRNPNDYYFLKVSRVLSLDLAILYRQGSTFKLVNPSQSMVYNASHFDDYFKLLFSCRTWYKINFTLRKSENGQYLVSASVNGTIHFPEFPMPIRPNTNYDQDGQQGLLGFMTFNNTKVRFKDIKIDPIE